MQLTKEQSSIIESDGNIKINAVAGSGKTTTLIAYAESRPKNSRILYLAFNKSVKLEATKKFKSKKLFNVDVQTAHSLAFKHIVIRNNLEINSNGYKNHELADILDIQITSEPLAEMIMANHVNKFTSYFCNSSALKVEELNYADSISDKKAVAFVKGNYSYIKKKTREFLAKMNTGEIAITHDFYLKKFQLQNPQLNYDYILFDEGQDASPAMLDVFLNQNAVKVIVGDTHQQIYSWRYAVNSLEMVNFKSFNLSRSFRFNDKIALLAQAIVDRKKHLQPELKFQIKGEGKPSKGEQKAVLARTNLGLLTKAIDYISEKKNLDGIYFEGNINSYTYADDGTSLYDVLNLYNGKRKFIRDPLIKKMSSLEDLEEYIDKTEDMQLGMMVELVREYGNEIPNYIKQLKEKHVENEDREKAHIIFSTVHRCKGMEYDSVQLVNDFLTEEKLKKVAQQKDLPDLIKQKLNEEINLLYVAITRTQNKLYIENELLPENWGENEQIVLLKRKERESEDSIKDLQLNKFEEKAYDIEAIRKKHKSAYAPWNDELDRELKFMFDEGLSIKDLANHFGRTKGAIRARIQKLYAFEDL
ncbi:DNA helicase [Marivirga tractuosa]|uniref:DNA 3'-5' helicase n=1 Tax=Marivirga tractuosa (strain ATCC 23168 / DSM 4126 / NBRC 15989 / NCIMB 1408 / VKM B-1430 / H-43) TaxID=643867 RepID=E4TSJ5_MARTH|nr:UvrD-helicase domain-containing protein [Marivirga tractuosa]ADR20815.1 superfamily I DNA/RNA helicase [Marivirga tractuosa DSM 4126]BDD14734.1 DNA helicase [Marivirga tractuosa]